MTPLILRTARLVLREFEDSDAPHANAYDSNPDVVRFMNRDPYTLEQSLAYIQKVRADSAAETPRRLFDLALHPVGMEHLVGRVGLQVVRPEHGEATIWYVTHPEHRGRGFVGEAMRALISYGFGELGLHRIFADCDPRNTGSLRVAERLGMTREAHLRENYLLKGEWCDSLIYAVLAREWPSQ